ncbi:MAG: hypothetical protein JAZ11_20895 [Candidatus Thiodiazotropha lotti]|nr:hypothetical protein [Candidatus Thiodiazotropha lotti]
MPWGHWGWNEKKPFLGDLTKFLDYEYLFVERDKLIERAYEQIQLSFDTKDDGIILVAGLPGVGKSTMLEFLIKRKFPEFGKRIGMIGVSHDALSGNAELETYQMLDIVSRINDHIHVMLKSIGEQVKSPNLKDEYKKHSSNNKKQDNFTLISELVASEIVPKAKLLQKNHGRAPQGVIAIDDVDYLNPYAQIQILTLLCAINDHTTNPIFLYTARPIAAGIAKHSVASRLGHSTSEPIRVNAIDPNMVIHSKMTDGYRSEYIDPFAKKEVQEFFRVMTNGNLRTAINFVKKATREGKVCISRSNPEFEQDCLLRALFGKKVESKEGLRKDMDRMSSIPNIFSTQFDIDYLPVIYITLLTVDALGSAKIDQQFLEKFNEYCAYINPKGTGQKRFDYGFIENCLWYCHKAHLIFRTAFDGIEDYISYRSTHHKGRRNTLMHTIFELTDRGKELLLMAREPLYQELAGLAFYRQEVQNKVDGMNYKLDSLADSRYIVDDWKI